VAVRATVTARTATHVLTQEPRDCYTGPMQPNEGTGTMDRMTEIAQTLAAEASQRAIKIVKRQFDNFLLNPSAANYVATTKAMEGLQEARNVQHTIAEMKAL
jgi:hypothetical protein